MENAQIFRQKRINMNIPVNTEPVNLERNQPIEAAQPEAEGKGGEHIMKLLYPITAIAGVIIAAYFAFMYITLETKAVENEARFQCAQSSRYSVAKNDTVIYYPAEELYKNCLDEKGVK